MAPSPGTPESLPSPGFAQRGFFRHGNGPAASRAVISKTRRLSELMRSNSVAGASSRRAAGRDARCCVPRFSARAVGVVLLEDTLPLFDSRFALSLPTQHGPRPALHLVTGHPRTSMRSSSWGRADDYLLKTKPRPAATRRGANGLLGRAGMAGTPGGGAGGVPALCHRPDLPGRQSVVPTLRATITLNPPPSACFATQAGEFVGPFVRSRAPRLLPSARKRCERLRRGQEPPPFESVRLGQLQGMPPRQRPPSRNRRSERCEGRLVALSCHLRDVTRHR